MSPTSLDTVFAQSIGFAREVFRFLELEAIVEMSVSVIVG